MKYMSTKYKTDIHGTITTKIHRRPGGMRSHHYQYNTTITKPVVSPKSKSWPLADWNAGQIFQTP